MKNKLLKVQTSNRFSLFYYIKTKKKKEKIQKEQKRKEIENKMEEILEKFKETKMKIEVKEQLNDKVYDEK